MLMKESAMMTKLKIKPLVGVLVHTGFWEGPCRGGKKVDLMPEQELLRAKEKYKNCITVLKKIIPRVEVLEPVFVAYTESFVLKDDTLNKINQDINKADAILLLNQRIPKIERFKKPIICYTHAVSGADTCAYLRSIGQEGYFAIDVEELNQLLHRLWVRKAGSKHKNSGVDRWRNANLGYFK